MIIGAVYVIFIMGHLNLICVVSCGSDAIGLSADVGGSWLMMVIGPLLLISMVIIV